MKCEWDNQKIPLYFAVRVGKGKEELFAIQSTSRI